VVYGPIRLAWDNARAFESALDALRAALADAAPVCAHRYVPLLGGCRCLACGHQIAWDAGLDVERIAAPAASRDAVERLAEEVRIAWVAWARTQPNPKPSWLVPWADLDEQSRDADRAIARHTMRVVPPPAPMGEAVRHRPGHRPPVGFNAVVEIVSASDLEADDVIFDDGRWLCVLDDGRNDSTMIMAAEIIDNAGGQDTTDTVYGEWFARVVALVPRESPSEEPAT
jgi:hypothetical protein